MIEPKDNFGYCFLSISPIRAEAKDEAEIVSQLLFGEPVRIIHLNNNWVEIITEKDNYQGFIDPKQLNPLTEDEFFDWIQKSEYLNNLFLNLKTPIGNQIISRGSFIGKNNQFIIGNSKYEFSESQSLKKNNDVWNLANEYLNTPYLWGGKSVFGIDCSGLTQSVYRIKAIELPRNASQQASIGASIEFQFKKPGDLAYFVNDNNKITHVGIIGPDSKIIHASGHVRIDTLTEKGIWNEKRSINTHILYSIKRVV